MHPGGLGGEQRKARRHAFRLPIGAEHDQPHAGFKVLAAIRDVPPADVPDVIEIAARRQDEARERDRGATRSELEAVARELEIAPEHVEAAIGELKQRRAADALRAEEAKAAAVVRKLKVVRISLIAAATALMLAIATLGAAFLGASGVHSAASAAHGAEARVDAVLERQAALAPQLASLAGADGGALTVTAATVREGPTLDARLAAANDLSLAMAQQLGALPPPTNDAEATLRLQLHDEVSGSQNRVTVELRRYREAESAWRDTAGHGLGALAVGFGFADAPPAAR